MFRQTGRADCAHNHNIQVLLQAGRPIKKCECESEREEIQAFFSWWLHEYWVVTPFHKLHP